MLCTVDRNGYFVIASFEHNFSVSGILFQFKMSVAETIFMFRKTYHPFAFRDERGSHKKRAGLQNSVTPFPEHRTISARDDNYEKRAPGRSGDCRFSTRKLRFPVHKIPREEVTGLGH